VSVAVAAPTHVFITADAVGGVWTYALDLTRGLARRNIRVTLCVLGPSPLLNQRQDAVDAGADVVLSELPLEWVEEDERALDRGARVLAEIANSSGADLVHLNSPAYASGAIRQPIVGACHSCLATWWEAVRGGPQPVDFQRRAERLGAGYRACERLIAPTLAFAAATQAVYGVEPVVVWNGRSPPPRVRETARARFVLTSGRLWDEAKNVAGLAAVAKTMRGRIEAAGPLEGPNGARAAHGRIVPLGRLDAGALAAKLVEAPVFVSLARYEPFGLGVLEAAQAGCALVLSDIPTFRELWQGAATFVGVDDAAGAAAALDDLLDDPEACARLGSTARARAARFSVDAMAERTLAVYRQALIRHDLRGAA
jgi:glycosyltransferase involved in cell wall biosynthesis